MVKKTIYLKPKFTLMTTNDYLIDVEDQAVSDRNIVFYSDTENGKKHRFVPTVKKIGSYATKQNAIKALKKARLNCVSKRWVTPSKSAVCQINMFDHKKNLIASKDVRFPWENSKYRETWLELCDGSHLLRHIEL